MKIIIPTSQAPNIAREMSTLPVLINVNIDMLFTLDINVFLIAIFK